MNVANTGPLERDESSLVSADNIGLPGRPAEWQILRHPK